jgi:hypothetical protein
MEVSMGLNTKNNHESPQGLETVSTIKQVEEFEEQLREENLHIYRQFRLKDSIAEAKNQDTNISTCE